MQKVFLVTFTGMNLDMDSAVLMKALSKRGIEGRSVAWDDPRIDWGEPDLCIIKSASNYVIEPDSFLRWVREVEEKTLLWNNSKLVEWNHDKHYLLELGVKGVPLPPSIFVGRNTEDNLNHYLKGSGWEDIVIKPTISCGSFGLKRFKADSPGAELFLKELTNTGYVQEFMTDTYPLSPRDAIIQPFIPDIASGEVSLIYFGGTFSHAVVKKAKAGDFRSHPIWGATVEQYNPSSAELGVADAVLRVTGPTEYARLDMVNTSHGPLLIEIELIEPFLFFDMFPETAEKFANHIQRSLK